MEKSVLFAMPITYILLSVIVILHLSALFFPVEKKPTGEKPVGRLPLIALYVSSALNVLTHVALFVFAIIKGAPAEDMLLALMISAAVGSVCIGFKKK